MQFEETITKQEGKDKYTNNIQTTQILKNDEVILPYCILDISGTVVTIKQGTMITQLPVSTPELQKIIPIFLKEEPKKETKKEAKKTTKTSKATVKGKKTDDKK